MSETLGTILTGAFTLLGVILGFFLTMLRDRVIERKQAKREFLKIKNSIIYPNTDLNTLRAKLKELWDFFCRYPSYMEKRENKDFINKWLRGTIADQEFLDQVNLSPKLDWEKEKTGEFLADLEKLKPLRWI